MVLEQLRGADREISGGANLSPTARAQNRSVLAQLDFLEGQYDAADRRALEIRALEEKPAGKLLSGLLLRSMVAADGLAVLPGDTTAEAGTMVQVILLRDVR